MPADAVYILITLPFGLIFLICAVLWWKFMPAYQLRTAKHLGILMTTYELPRWAEALSKTTGAATLTLFGCLLMASAIRVMIGAF